MREFLIKPLKLLLGTSYQNSMLWFVEQGFVEVIVAVHDGLTHGIQILFLKTPLLQFLAYPAPHPHDLVIRTEEKRIPIFSYRGVIVPAPEIERCAYLLPYRGFMVGNLIKNAVLREPLTFVKPEILVLQKLPPVTLPVDENYIFVPTVDFPTVTNRLFLNKGGVQEVKTFIDGTQDEMQSVVIQETIITVTEHDVLGIPMLYTVIPCFRKPGVRFNIVVDFVAILPEMGFIQNHIRAIVDYQNLDVVEVYPVLKLYAVEQELTDFPRFFIMGNYNAQFLWHLVFLMSR